MQCMQNLMKESISIDDKAKRKSMFSMRIVKQRSYVDGVKNDFEKIVKTLKVESKSKNQEVRNEVMGTFAILF